MVSESSPRRALLSVADKQGIVEFGRGLVAAGFQLISTGGTLAALHQAGLPVQAVEEVTGWPEMLDGRVKTLHPHIHGAILGRRDLPEHQADWQRHDITPIDLVAVNLYPFAQAWHSGATDFDLLEQIDIGGPAMIRAAAKNWPWVTVVTNPAAYQPVLQALAADGDVRENMRRQLAVEAFTHTAYYDAVVAAGLGQMGALPEPAPWTPPAAMVIPLQRQAQLRYGENPHQQAALYTDAAVPPWAPAGQRGLMDARQLQGKELSFNNLQDAQGAVNLVLGLTEPAAAAVKHTIPCGAACGPTLAEAFRRARDTDPVSIFGGIVAVNRPLDGATASLLAEIFLEVVLAPEVTEEARDILAQRKNLRVLELPLLAAGQPVVRAQGGTADAPFAGPVPGVGLFGLDARRLPGGLLLQEEDRQPAQPQQWQVVTQAEPPANSRDDQLLAWHLVRQLPSNAIVLVKNQRAVGFGAARTSRVEAVELAVAQAGEAAQGAVLASDAFFPFADGVEVAAQAGVKVVVQPGGSIRDEEVIAACNRHWVAMLMTGIRHFRH